MDGIFGCFVNEVITRDDRMTRDPLDEEGRRNGVDGVADSRCSQMR